MGRFRGVSRLRGMTTIRLGDERGDQMELTPKVVLSEPLMRPAEAIKTSTWADLRWLVQPVRGGEEASTIQAGLVQPVLNDVRSRLSVSSGRRLRVELLHCREGTPGGAVHLEIDDETGAVRVVPPLAAATSVPRAAGA